MDYILAIILCSVILAVFTNTIEIFYEKIIKYRESFTGKTPSVKKRKNEPFLDVIKKIILDLRNELEKVLILDSNIKWRVWTYLFAFSYLFFMSTFNIQLTNKLFIIISYTIFIIFLIGVGDFIHNVKVTGLINLIIYLIKWNIFLIYPHILLTLFLENLSRIDVLLITIVILLTYSFLFVKNVIDNFKYYLFQFVHFVTILIFFNLYIIGLTFGAFYYENNSTYKYFTIEEINKLNDNEQFDFYDITLITIKGIEPFFNFPSKLGIENTMMYYIPIIEHLIGNIYLLLIIGFFVSYSVGMLIDRKKL